MMTKKLGIYGYLSPSIGLFRGYSRGLFEVKRVILYIMNLRLIVLA